MRHYISLCVIFFISINLLSAQWTNRYPKVDGFGHHVYLEGYELPILNAGPTDPAPSPSGESIVFAAKGWLWLLDLKSLVAKRITTSSAVDSSPNWSPDGTQIVFVRDNSLDTNIVLLDIFSNKETILIDTEKLDLDPIFSQDGKHIYYASGEHGSIDLWRLDLSSKENTAITDSGDLERLPVSVNSDEGLIYLKKMGFSYDSIELLDLSDNKSHPLAEENFTSQANFSLSPDNRTLVYSWPHGDDYELRLLDIQIPKSTLLLTKSSKLPLFPKFSYDGNWVYYCESNENERTQLKRISVNGGIPELIEITNWDFNTPTGKLKIISKVDNKISPVRMNIINSTGHPILPETGSVRSDGQNGLVFFYSPGEIEIEAPLGEITVTAVHGFSTQIEKKTIVLNRSDQTTEINLTKIWDAQANGWYSGDNHFHLNYGGTNQLNPTDIVLDLKGEDVDVGFPLLANLGQRFLEQDLWNWNRDETPLIYFGQEVRSHFLGHLGLLGIKDLYWPWVWGPRYDIYGRDDRLNAEPLRFARSQNALGGYVHPVSVRDPFNENGSRRIPIELIADSVLGETDIIELGCLWSDEIGTANLWHKFLNLGLPITASAGSDVMNDLYRTMAIGATRVYVKPEEPLTINSYLKALKEGKSFVSNGPLVEFEVDGKIPGEVIEAGQKKVSWTLTVHAPIAFNKVEIFVNGNVVATKKGMSDTTSKTYKGSLSVPNGGWVTVRVSGGDITWPLMDSYPYAETSPIWFNNIGSINSTSAKESAQTLLNLLEVSKSRLNYGYGSNPIPKLNAHFEKARLKLLAIIKDQ